ncbi:hypothetical protein [Terriglobus albidus]|uniref:hypothetical protein n=1 Tax=Terriglobus albidus TaxID=1592106 RepID=UPI0021E0AD2C|nr:hypothetical protein [Terriglobus albidus]
MDFPEEFTSRIRRLERLACPTPQDEIIFHPLMAEAKDRRLSYKEALEFTIRVRAGGAD